MRQWYRSGLEGYCKACAQVMGLPDNNSGWGNFGRDIFCDGRFDDSAKASKTWVLSRFRAQGRSNRLKIFEESWLGKHGRDFELEAIHTCVHTMSARTGDSTLYELLQSAPDTFAKDFHNVVLPAIAEGFEAERYHPSDIACFLQGIDYALENIDVTLPQTFRNFAIPLVAGLIYGPDHAAARSGVNTVTVREKGDESSALPQAAVDMSSIILTQLFCDDAGLIGYSGTYDKDHAIFLGRDLDFTNFANVCDGELASAIEQKKPIAFPLSHTHTSTSRAHGVIVRTGDNWYYYDLSTNGSYVENVHQPSSVHRGAVALAPGDRIYLGLGEPPANDAATYRLATAILVSFKLDESFERSR